MKRRKETCRRKKDKCDKRKKQIERKRERKDQTTNVSDLWLSTVKILKIGTPEIITIIVLQLEQLDFTVQYCVQKMQTE